MHRKFVRWVALGGAGVLLAGGASGVAVADPTPPAPSPASSPPALPTLGSETVDELAPTQPSAPAEANADDLPNPLETDRRSFRDEAWQDVLAGHRKIETVNGSKIVRLGRKQLPLTREQREQARRGHDVTPRTVEQAVELSRSRTDRVFVLLVDFGDTRSARFPDTDTDPDIPGPQRFDGPLHNTIAEPDRTRDNTTIWQPDFSRSYYQNLYFGSGSQSLKSYYERQSSGRYSIEGEVSDWLTVPFNEARYGRSNGYPCPGNVCGNSWYLVRDALDAWVNQQVAAGRSLADIKATLASYDQWDRYDLDGDKNFNEPDGYLDHLQIVHAGGDQAADDAEFGEDAIWSHRWRAFQSGEVGNGPADYPQIGGTEASYVEYGSKPDEESDDRRVGLGVWAADYTMQAENAGMAVFAHEYGHDLGLPDHYDTADSGDNAVNWWSLMGQSRVSARGDVGVGTRAADLSAWDKLQLGWLDYTVAAAGEEKSIQLGPHEYNSAKSQALVVTVPTPLPTPSTGSRQWWSGARNNYASGLARLLALPAATKTTLSFQAEYNIEDCADGCDAAYVEVDQGSGFQTVPGTITTGSGNRITGRSDGWVSAQFDLSAYAGKTIALRFRYATNAATLGEDPSEPTGLFLDDLVVTADETTVFRDGAENGAGGWSVYDFRNVGDADVPYRYYLASYRADLSYDRYLKTGPYNLGWPTRPRLAEHFPYQNGLLVSYWDKSYADNNTSVHPGAGLILPVDAHPRLLRTSAGTPWRGRIQTYDAPFSTRPSDSILLHHNGRPNLIRGQRAQPLFDDTRNFWNSEQPMVGVKTPKQGVTLRVVEQTGSTMTVELGTKADSPAATLAVGR